MVQPCHKPLQTAHGRVGSSHGCVVQFLQNRNDHLITHAPVSNPPWETRPCQESTRPCDILNVQNLSRIIPSIWRVQFLFYITSHSWYCTSQIIYSLEASLPSRSPCYLCLFPAFFVFTLLLKMTDQRSTDGWLSLDQFLPYPVVTMWSSLYYF